MNERLKKLRKSKKLLQSDMAQKLEISQSAYSHYEKGIRIPDAITLNKLADIFDCTTDYLLGRTESEELAILEGEELPKELRDIGIEYLKVNKIAKEKGFTPEDIREILETIDKIKNNNH
ncbi:MAG: helix-turn-helix transcriptional regulator [Marinisporobacter sp.]|nr:helix-turn-helix transcriptional regulator [Marinisporobacter sp.]